MESKISLNKADILWVFTNLVWHAFVNESSYGKSTTFGRAFPATKNKYFG